MKAIKITALSAVLASSVFAGGIKLSDSELAKMTSEKRAKELLTLRLQIDSEKLKNEHLILAQRIHDLEEAFKHLDCASCSSVYDRRAQNAKDDKRTQIILTVEPDIVIDNDSSDCAQCRAGQKGEVANLADEKVPSESQSNAEMEGLLTALNQPGISAAQREAFLSEHLKKQTLNKSDETKPNKPKKTPKKPVKIEDFDYWMLLNKGNIEHSVKVTSELLNIRQLPSTAAPVVGKLKKGDVVNFSGVARPLATSGALWLKIDKGYVFAGLTNFKEVVKLSTQELKSK